MRTGSCSGDFCLMFSPRTASRYATLILILTLCYPFPGRISAQLVILDGKISLTQLAQQFLDSHPNTESSSDVNKHGTSLPIGSFKPCSASSHILQDKRLSVRRAIEHAWDAYNDYAWGYDELMPLSRRGRDTFGSGLGVTIIDSLTTLYMVEGLEDRYKVARQWVAVHLDFSKVGEVSLFETVIRILGGLISIFQMSGDEIYLHKAQELGARLAPCFDTAFGLPSKRCKIGDATGGSTLPRVMRDDTLFLAEVGTVQLEFAALSHHSTHSLFKVMGNITRDIVTYLEGTGSVEPRLGNNMGLVPFALSLNSGKWTTRQVTLGAPADSYFEYLVKKWVQSGKREMVHWERFAKVMDGICDTLCYTSGKGDTIVMDMKAMLSDKNKLTFEKRMDHLSCYIPGMIILGLDGLGEQERERRYKWEWVAEQLTETCFKMYERSPSGLSGEVIHLSSKDKWLMTGGYQLRPEAVEAFFYMFRHTKKEKYRTYAWHVFEYMEKHCRVTGGYATLELSATAHPRKSDIMHSFLISETLKYMYLIFGDDKEELPLDKWVFNTEAHPLLVTPAMGQSQ